MKEINEELVQIEDLMKNVKFMSGDEQVEAIFHISNLLKKLAEKHEN